MAEWPHTNLKQTKQHSVEVADCQEPGTKYKQIHVPAASRMGDWLHNTQY